MVKVGVGDAVPVPVSETRCGEPVALSVMESDAAKVVAESGVKLTEMVRIFIGGKRCAAYAGGSVGEVEAGRSAGNGDSANGQWCVASVLDSGRLSNAG